jgi:hypothetical protein
MLDVARYLRPASMVGPAGTPPTHPLPVGGKGGIPSMPCVTARSRRITIESRSLYDDDKLPTSTAQDKKIKIMADNKKYKIFRKEAGI